MRRIVALFGIALGILLGIVLFTQGHRDIPVAELEAEFASPPSQWLDWDGWRIHYRDEGEGTPLLLLHGTAANLHTWQGWVDTLSKRFRCIRVDLPGFGLTGPAPDQDYSMMAYGRFLDHVLDALDLDSVAIAGNSLGGQIAWNYALQRPDRVSRLVLIDAAGFPSDVPTSMGFRMAKTPIMRRAMTWLTPKALVRKSLNEVYVQDELVTDSLVDRYFRSLLRAGNRQAFVDRVNTVYSDRTDSLDLIQAPTLVLWGKEDAWIPVSHARRFERALPNAEVIVYPGSGHIPQEEIPYLTARTVEGFLCASGW